MREYKYLFGPVPSRRFGRSLGVDLTPHKTCTFDCIFCQAGRTTNKTLERKEYVPAERVIEELGDWLEADGNADYITLSGSGEPTLHSRFGEVLQFIRRESTIPTLLLTNGSLLYHREVREAACHASVVKVSLSAWDQRSFERINRPHPELALKRVVEGEYAFRQDFEGELRMEVFLLAGLNSVPADVEKIARIADSITADRIELNTAVRPAAEEIAVALDGERMEQLTELFTPRAEVIAEFSSDRSPEVAANEQRILATLERRPVTAEEIAGVFGMHAGEVAKYLGKLARTGRIRAEHREGEVFYVAARSAPGFTNKSSS
jgi:wyosine [tRNA(Phe)-imidazoG37] synthetase (radical SAM superfamily)